MSAAHMPAQEPVLLGCPRKTHADGRELRFLNDTVEICFYAILLTRSGVEVRDDIVCISVARSTYDAWLLEVLPMAMEAAMRAPGLYAVQ